MSWGRQGVALFFTLSGYLITLSLLRNPGLPGFFLRRARRIFPAFYAYLGCVTCLAGAGIYQLKPTALLASATYWSNFYPGNLPWPLQHTWSLAVEEQFYLSWPILLGLGGAGLASLVAGTLLLGHLGVTNFGSSEEALFEASFDLIVWGCLAALLRERQPVWCQKMTPTPALIFPLACLLLVYASTLPPVWLPPLRGLGFAWLMLWVSQNQASRVTRALDVPLLTWVGRRSYSIYLWHVLFLDPRLPQGLGRVGSLVAMLTLSQISFLLFEKNRISPKQSGQASPGENASAV